MLSKILIGKNKNNILEQNKLNKLPENLTVYGDLIYYGSRIKNIKNIISNKNIQIDGNMI